MPWPLTSCGYPTTAASATLGCATSAPHLAHARVRPLFRRLCRVVHHLARDPLVLDPCIAIGKAAPLRFFLRAGHPERPRALDESRQLFRHEPLPFAFASALRRASPSTRTRPGPRPCALALTTISTSWPSAFM